MVGQVEVGDYKPVRKSQIIDKRYEQALHGRQCSKSFNTHMKLHFVSHRDNASGNEILLQGDG